MFQSASPDVDRVVSLDVEPVVVLVVGPGVVPDVGPIVVGTGGPIVVPDVVHTVTPTVGPIVVPDVVHTVTPTVGPIVVPDVSATVAPTIGPIVVPDVGATVAPTVDPIVVSGHTVTPTTPNIENQGNTALDIDYMIVLGSNVSSIMPCRIMKSNVQAKVPKSVANDPASEPFPWGRVGDECVICTDAMMDDEEVTDLDPCRHT